MLINLLSILSQEGKEQEFQMSLEADYIRQKRNQYKIVNKEPVQIHLKNKGNKVVELTGGVKLEVMVACARCLELVKVPFDVEFDYELDMKQTEEERMENLDELSFLSGLDLDVEQLVYNEILLNWPIRVLCKEDCQGICSHCGVNLNKVTCECDTHELDPRMAAISDIFSKFKEV